MHRCICPRIGANTHPSCRADDGKPANQVVLPHAIDCHCYIRRVPMTTLRAKTYQVVAHGDCPICENADVNLRFTYNPYGDDILCCEGCARQSDESFAKNE